MNLQRAAEIQVVLEGVKLPATREQLVHYAALQDAEAAVELERIPNHEYRSIDDVGEELWPTKPLHVSEERLPRPESGLPPGGDDYLRPFPESGRVDPGAPPDNPPQKAIAEASKAQKQQQDEDKL
ncbi:MAG: hypothetical protein QOH23_1936 [Gaiellaceae bacterium]|jgi:hypothetical protein|nr:hypothetical protein [Gaiellaceae bacterium]